MKHLGRTTAAVALTGLIITACGSVTPVGSDGSGQAGQGGAGTGGGGAGTGGGGAGTGGGGAGTGGGGAGTGGGGAGVGGNPCHGLTETQCQAKAGCAPGNCGGCTGGPSYSGCYQPATESAPPCPGFACPQLPPCAMVTTLEACELRRDCHSVFVDPATCGCAAVGCCAHFSRCADGDKALCTGMPLCRAATPFCEGKFVVSYTATCYDGCVDMKDCSP